MRSVRTPRTLRIALECPRQRVSTVSPGQRRGDTALEGRHRPRRDGTQGLGGGYRGGGTDWKGPVKEQANRIFLDFRMILEIK